MSCFVDEMVANEDNVLNYNEQMNGSYESSIDIFAHDDRFSCDNPIPFDSYTTNPSNVYKNNNGCHETNLHQAYLIDEDEFELKPATNEIELVFKQVSHSISTGTTNERQILSDINGFASAGQILAVMGPSGSGKTTFLNILSGRTKSTFGEITLNGQPMNKQIRRQICYVLQQDIFFPNLTLKQTLMYTARLRLPDSMKDSEKCSLVNKIIEELQLKTCENTIIGDTSKRGLSGGEKKRANIACELLTNPSVMLIDEPTSGLDSCTAHSLIQLLKNFASRRKKTIVMSIHQPSSQMFYLLDSLLLLSNGQLAYFGNIIGIVPFFNSIGYCISIHYNPAEFILEKVKDSSCEKKIIEAAKNLSKLPNRFLQTENKYHHFNQTKHCTNNHIETSKHDSWNKESLKSIELHTNEDNQVFQKFNNVGDNDSGRSSWLEPDRSSTLSSSSYIREECTKKNKLARINGQKWPTSLMTQVKVLTERNFIESKHRMLSKLNWIQTVILGFMVGFIWFQIVRKEETINDIRGWMFFTTTYWMLFGLFQAVVSFPSEREVINKERSSGAYRLSSYYIAKMIGELPLTIALPSVFFLISYSMLGCHSVKTFFYLWFFLIISTICAQSFGLFVGVTCSDLDVSVTTSALYSLSTMLFAGYYTSMPSWLSWVRYLSIVYYSFQNMQMIEFGQTKILCAQHSSKYDYCLLNGNATNPTYIPYNQLELNLDLMSQNTKPFPIWFNTMMLIIFLFLFRSLGYLILRYYRKPLN